MERKLITSTTIILLFLFLAGCTLFSAIGEVAALRRGLKYGSQGEFNKAKEQFKKLTSEGGLDSFFIAIYLKIADDALTHKIKENAAKHLFSAIAYNSALSSKPDEAITEIKQCLNYNPDYDESHFYLALAYKDKGKIDDAIYEFKRVFEINPNHVLTHYNLASVYLKKKMVDEAIDEFKKSVDIYSDIPQAHYGLAILYTDKEEYNLAIKHIDIALQQKKYLESIGIKIDPGLVGRLNAYRK